MKALVAWIARILLDPSLLYWAQFTTTGWQMVQVDKIDAPPLMAGGSGHNGQQSPLEQPFNQPGLRINVTKDPVQASVAFHGALTPWPSKLPSRFTVVADFFLPPDFQLPAGTPFGSSQEGVRWAAVVGLRNADDLDADVDSDGAPDVRLAGATHQVRNFAEDGGGRIALNTGNGTTPPTPTADFVPPSVAYPSGVANRRFRLELEIDMGARRGASRLRTPGKTWGQRSWTLQPNFGQPTAVCFGLAMNAGSGTASATATSFRIYDRSFGWWIRTVLALDAYPVFR